MPTPADPAIPHRIAQGKWKKHMSIAETDQEQTLRRLTIEKVMLDTQNALRLRTRGEVCPPAGRTRHTFWQNCFPDR